MLARQLISAVGSQEFINRNRNMKTICVNGSDGGSRRVADATGSNWVSFNHCCLAGDGSVSSPMQTNRLTADLVDLRLSLFIRVKSR